jgi:hypothetical protein
MKIGRADFLKRLAILAGIGGAVATCTKSTSAKPLTANRELTIENLQIAVQRMKDAQRRDPQILIVRPHFCDPDIARKIIETTSGGGL